MQQSTRGSQPVAAAGTYGSLRAVAVICGLVIESLGLFVLIGWILHIDALIRLGRGSASMKFNTAFILVLLGGGIVAGAGSKIARVACVSVAAIVVVTLGEYVFRWDAGIDETFFHDVAGGTSHPGRMAVTTALCLLFAAWALFALRSDRPRLVTTATLGMMTIGWFGCLGYLFGVRALYDVGPFSTMSAPTAAAMVIVGLGLLASTPDGPLAWIARGDDPGATLLRRILPLALIGMPVVGGLRLMGQHAGWFGTEFGLAIMVIFASSSVVAVALHGARLVNRSHAARERANLELSDLNRSLEVRIDERTVELATTEAWARTLADSAPIGIFHSNSMGKRTYVNDRTCEIYGIARQDALGDAIGTGIHIEDRERVLAEWNGAIAAGTDFDSEFRVVRPTGETLWVHSHGRMVRSAEGVFDGSVGTVADITSNHEAASAVREAEERFRASFESSPIGIALADGGGRIVRANRALCEMTGYPAIHLVGMRAQSLLSPDDVGFNEDRDLASTGDDQRIIRSDGSVRWASIRYAQIGQNVPGDPALTIAQFVDTTERRGFEERLAHLADHDPLTGLMNRRSFDAALKSHVAHCRRYGASGAVLMLDLDDFKGINDSKGHDAGDQVLVETADRLRRRLRETDVIARVGGDEFVVLLPVGGATDARAVAQILVEEIDATSVIVDDASVPVSASIGVAVFDEVDRSPEEMLANADLAMYDAKELGRDRWAEFVPGSTPVSIGPRSGREAGAKAR
jgi:diguanylate cyclase (GGDEF)-like protein/PAS domain S-box-containing protein